MRDCVCIRWADQKWCQDIAKEVRVWRPNFHGAPPSEITMFLYEGRWEERKWWHTKQTIDEHRKDKGMHVFDCELCQNRLACLVNNFAKVTFRSRD